MFHIITAEHIIRLNIPCIHCWSCYDARGYLDYLYVVTTIREKTLAKIPKKMMINTTVVGPGNCRNLFIRVFFYSLEYLFFIGQFLVMI